MAKATKRYEAHLRRLAGAAPTRDR
jgi:hypothetical protein